MKKISFSLLTFLLAALVSVSLLSCGGDDDGSGKNPPSSDEGEESSYFDSNSTYTAFLVVKGLTEDNFRFFNYSYSINNQSEVPITKNDEILMFESQHLNALKINIKITPKDNIRALIDREALYQVANNNGFGLRVVSSNGKVTETPNVDVTVITNTGRYILANLNYFCGGVQLVYNGRTINVMSSEAPLVEPGPEYTYLINTSKLTADNFRFIDYTYSVAGTDIQNQPITGPDVLTILDKQDVSELTVVVNATAKADISTQMQPLTNYSWADMRAISITVKSSDGSEITSPYTVNIITNTGHYLLSNIAYFTGSTTFKTHGTTSIDTSMPSQPALQEPDLYVTEGEAIDLGLSVLWASENVLTNKQVHNQSYFAWGETRTKSDYTWDTYAFYSNGRITKYNTTDGKSRLDLADDVANVVLGGNWRMPTKQEAQDLVSKCTWTWGQYKGWKGYRVTGPNGNSIFLPACGHLAHNTIALYGMALDWQKYGSYWTSEVLSTTGQYAYQAGAIIGFHEGSYNTTELNARYGGCSVRAVMPK